MAPKHYRFHSLRFYSVTQMLAHEQRRYRSVFDESELGRLYCELTLYNKAFDEADWPFKCEFRIYDQAWNRHVGTLPYDGTISKNDNLVRVWGWKGEETPRSFWREGQYRWEVKRLARMPQAARAPETRRTLLANDIGAAVLPEPGKTPGSGAYR